jgi:hypothetical protein
MATNDRVLIDGILDDRTARGIPSADRGEAFELFVFEQLLKTADLSSEQVESGWVDGDDDGGIDGFFVFVNGHLAPDLAAVKALRRADLHVWLISTKHHDTFKQAVVDKLVASVPELLDFGKPSGDLGGRYSADLLKVRDHLLGLYRSLATRIESFKVTVVYASRGDTAAVGAEVRARAEQLTGDVKALFAYCDYQFQFVGAAELVLLSRKTRRYTLELPFVEYFGQGERYVLLTHLDDYARFVSDEDGHLRRYLFDSNVRDFVGLNRVNEDIAASLEAVDGPDFWWLNNGITLLATKAIIVGKAIALDDVQIVNGLQTTESIARHFERGGQDPARRAVLVKVIRTSDPSVRDAIIRATNNQTAVEQQSLHATDKIQRDIEDVFAGSGLYYERRQNFYSNQGISPELIVSPLYLAAARVGLLLRSPSAASHLKQRALRNAEAYATVFSESVPLGAWPKIAAIAKRIDAELNLIRGTGRGGERFLKTWRHIIALGTVSRVLGRFSFSGNEIASFDLASLTSEHIRDTWAVVQDDKEFGRAFSKRRLGRPFVLSVCQRLAEAYDVKDVNSVEPTGKGPIAGRRLYVRLDKAFIDAVDATLAPQPWPVGEHSRVAKVLNSRPAAVSAAITELIRLGRRTPQRDGKLVINPTED